ncbi:MAG TPA: hypothetical protein VGX46_03535, partial [Vicinamibacterales bacterium]|nr:hypothetical protein [Vicinamibacterales bacterium]
MMTSQGLTVGFSVPEKKKAVEPKPTARNERSTQNRVQLLEVEGRTNLEEPGLQHVGRLQPVAGGC